MAQGSCFCWYECAHFQLLVAIKLLSLMPAEISVFGKLLDFALFLASNFLSSIPEFLFSIFDFVTSLRVWFHYTSNFHSKLWIHIFLLVAFHQRNRLDILKLYLRQLNRQNHYRQWKWYSYLRCNDDSDSLQSCFFVQYPLLYIGFCLYW